MSTGRNNSGAFPLLLSLLSNLLLFTGKLPKILTQTIITFRNLATDTQCAVLDIFQEGKFTFAISQISIIDVDKRSCPMLDTQLFLRAESLNQREQLVGYIFTYLFIYLFILFIYLFI
jgi:hypothetical protein